MIQYEPWLQLRELVVTRKGEEAFSQQFHTGLNVMSGENGSGKTTIADFIVFALGGEPRSWREAALSCDSVLAEVLVNGVPVSIRREISGGRRQRPTSVYWGELKDARTADVAKWQTYPFAAHGDKVSFSQVLLEALGVPEVKLEQSSQLTIHQLLRLLYIDQSTAFGEIFVHEDFDRYATRQAIGEVLFGIYDHDLYVDRRKIQEYESELSGLETQVKAILAVFGSEGDVLDPVFIVQSIETLSRERDGLYGQLNTSRGEDEGGTGREVSDQERVLAETRKSLEELRTRYASLSRSVDELGLEIADSSAFVESLKNRIRALDDADEVKKRLGEIEFTVCPACLSPLEEGPSGHCVLCGRKGEGDTHSENLLRVRRTLSDQVKESEARIVAMEADRLEASRELRAVAREGRALSQRHHELANSVRTNREFGSAETFRRIGYLDAQIEQMSRQGELAERLSTLNERRSHLASEVERLKIRVERGTARQVERRGIVYERVDRLTREVLARDLPRQEEFGRAGKISFDLAANSVKVDGRDNFAASSMVYLKNAFHLALLRASMELSFMRLPRFMVFDNVEDKGMEPPRSHNFQELVAEMSEGSEVEHQIIMLTSMLSAKIEKSVHVVRKPFSHTEKSLTLS